MRETLSLNFWDIDRKSSPNGLLFHKGQAKKVVDFIDDIQKENDDSILVAHCHAGISRSGAVGTFACDYCGLDYDEFLSENKYIMSNPHVLKMLATQSGKPDSFKWNDGIDHDENNEFIILPPWAQKKGDESK